MSETITIVKTSVRNTTEAPPSRGLSSMNNTVASGKTASQVIIAIL
jgi:hypothetical protein